MKHASLKVLTAVLATSLLALTAVGCGNNTNTSDTSSTSSTASAVSDTSPTESSKPTDEQSKTSSVESKTSDEESKDASKEESVTTPSEEVSQEPDTESTESTESTERTDTSDASDTESLAEESPEPSEEPIDLSVVAVGSWTMTRDTNYINLTLHEDGVVVAEISGMMDHPIGSWSVEGEQITITLLDTPTAYRYENDQLISVENDDEVYSRGTTVSEQPEASQLPPPVVDADTLMGIIAGDWTMSTEDGYTNLTLAEDGVVIAEMSSLTDAIIGSWEVDGSSVTISLAGADAVYDYVNDMLLNREDPTEAFYRGTTIGE